MTRTQLGDRAAFWLTLAIMCGVFAVHWSFWPLWISAAMFTRWGVARIMTKPIEDAAGKPVDVDNDWYREP